MPKFFFILILLINHSKMTLINSISGIRGTIGGKAGEGLSPVDVIKFTGAFGSWLKSIFADQRITVVVGRDARISGPMVNKFVSGTLQSLGIDVIDGGVTTTPAVEMEVISSNAHGGVIITASHNPQNWNALKLLNENGEFITAQQALEMQQFANIDNLKFVGVEKMGTYKLVSDFDDKHIKSILDLPLVDVEAIKTADFSIVVDGINSSGSVAVPRLLDALGASKIFVINEEPHGKFAHNPEPLPENLAELASEVLARNADLGIAVDPDVDRLAIICEDGEPFGEEYTLVAVADYVLMHNPGCTVSNLSSTQALADVAKQYGQLHYSSAVGEVNVVEVMKKHGAVIGGEGNGGVIYPELHYGRDALVGVALFLTHLAKYGKSCSALKKKYPEYHMSKKKLEISSTESIAKIFSLIEKKYHKQEVDKTDGIKITFEDMQWVHMRSSNTEPIIRIYCESNSMVKANNLCNKFVDDIREILNSNDTMENGEWTIKN
jgi:phosphomannomutase